MQNIDLKQKLPDNTRVAIYGTSSSALSLVSLITRFLPTVQVVFFIDSFKDGTLVGRPIIKVDNLDKHKGEYDLIIIASVWYKEIEQTLLSLNIKNYTVSGAHLYIDNYPDVKIDFRAQMRKKDTTTTYIKRDICPVCGSKHSVPSEYNEVLFCPDCEHLYAQYAPDLNSVISKSYNGKDYWQNIRKLINISTLHEGKEWEPFIKSKIELLEKAQFFADFDKTNSKFFEIGCFEGMILKYLMNQGYHVFGCDVNTAISEAATAELCVPIINKPIEELQLPEESLDGIFSFHTFEHLLQPGEVLAKCAKMLKKGGKILINIPVNNNDVNVPDHYQFFSTHSVEYMMKLYFTDVRYEIQEFMSPIGEFFQEISIHGIKG